LIATFLKKEMKTIRINEKTYQFLIKKKVELMSKKKALVTFDEVIKELLR
jgi:hypothetical protein